jgi:hypothetical protein
MQVSPGIGEVRFNQPEHICRLGRYVAQIFARYLA